MLQKVKQQQHCAWLFIGLEFSGASTQAQRTNTLILVLPFTSLANWIKETGQKVMSGNLTSIWRETSKWQTLRACLTFCLAFPRPGFETPSPHDPPGWGILPKVPQPAGTQEHRVWLCSPLGTSWVATPCLAQGSEPASSDSSSRCCEVGAAHPKQKQCLPLCHSRDAAGTDFNWVCTGLFIVYWGAIHITSN